MKICLTGKMEQNRMSETRRFDSYGIQVMKKVTSNVDYLVTGSAPGWNKLNDAKRHNTTIMTETEFFDMLIEEMPEFLL